MRGRMRCLLMEGNEIFTWEKIEMREERSEHLQKI